MNCLRTLEYLLLFLLHRACGEEAEPTFRAAGQVFRMGNCFGVDYIVVYRCRPEGDQLLGNSSADSPAITPPADLQGRVHVSARDHLVGLQIHPLQNGDSGIYRRECWKNQTRVNQHTHRLLVCDQEAESAEFIREEKGGRAELKCDRNSTDLKGTSVSWYIELLPHYRLKLFLDSSVSLDPLVAELQGAVEVGNGGTSLSMDNSFVKNNQEIYCLVMKEKKCLVFQNMFQPIHSESMDVFALLGEKVVLGCPFEDNTQQWETPLGALNSSSVRNKQMYISAGGTPKTFSLVIPAVSDKHVGEYMCITPSMELQYSLSLCPSKPTKENVVSKDGSTLLECDVGQEDYQGLKWFRQHASGEYELIHDTNDNMVRVPDDLVGRMTLFKNGSSLTISEAKTEAGFIYSCVVLGDVEITLDEYEDDYGEEDKEEDKEYYDTVDPSMILEAHKCIFKQNYTLRFLIKTTNAEDNFGTRVTSKPRSDLDTTRASETGSNSTITGISIGLVVLVVVAVIAAIILRNRRRAAANQTEVPQPMDDIDVTRSLNRTGGAAA